jgi:uncharacterized membrane protein
MSLSARILLFLLIVVLIGGSSLWLIGGKKIEHSTSLVIDAQPQQVFPYLIESDRLIQWVSGLESVEDLEMAETGDPAIITERIMDDGSGKQVQFDDEVIRHEPDELLSVQSSNSSKIITAIYQLESTEEEKTQLNYRIKISHTSLGRFLAPFQKPNIQQRMEDDLRRLKDLVVNSPSAQTNTAEEMGPPSASSNEENEDRQLESVN